MSPTIVHAQTPEARVKSTSSVCLGCGTIQKSGKISCCGRGGSWFGNCGGAGNANLEHTWSEGILACKDRQFEAVVGQQLHPPYPTSKASSDDADMSATSNAILAAHVFSSTSASTSVPLSGATRTTLRADTAVTTPGHDDDTNTEVTITKMLYVTVPVNVFTPKRIIDRVNGTVVRSMQSASSDIFMATSPHTPASVSVTARDRDKLSVVIGAILTIVCW